MRFKILSCHGAALLALIFVTLPCVTSEAQCNVQQIFKLLPDDGAADNRFGVRVAVSGTTVIVGAVWDADNQVDSGSAYLFDTITGEQIAKLFPAVGAGDDLFGRPVAIDGTIAIVGAYGDDDYFGSAYLFDTTTGQQIAKLVADDRSRSHFGESAAISGTTAVVGAHFDGGLTGAAYLFDVTTGLQTFKLLADDGETLDHFGGVSISGTTAIVGAHGDDDNGDGSGSAYLFDTTTGQQLAKLLADDGAANDSFGGSVAISGTTAIVGAAYADDDAGSAYLFDTITGQQTFKLMADDRTDNDLFGYSVGITGTIAIVGARRDDDNGESSGSAYVFDVTTGQQIAKFLPDDGAAGDFFGRAVAISGTTVVIGASGDDDNGSASGSAYLFDINCSDVVAADSYIVTRGSYVSGGVVELAESDNADLSLQRATADTQSRAEFEVKAVSPVASPSSFEVTLEGAVFARSTVNQTIEFYDYLAGSWEQIDTRAATQFTDSTVTVAASGDLSRFVEAGTMCIEARIRYQSPVARQQFSSNTDQFIWTIGQ